MHIFEGGFQGRPTFQRNIGVQADGELLNDARIDFVLNQTQIDRVLAYSLPLHVRLVLK